MNFSGSGTLCAVSFESLMELQMLDGWSDTAPDERTEDNLQTTGKLTSSRLKDVSKGGRAHHNRRTDNGKNHDKQESQKTSYCFARLAFPTPIQCISNTYWNANLGTENGAHYEASAQLAHQRKKADSAGDHSTGGKAAWEVPPDKNLFQFLLLNNLHGPYFFYTLLLLPMLTMLRK